MKVYGKSATNSITNTAPTGLEKLKNPDERQIQIILPSEPRLFAILFNFLCSNFVQTNPFF